MSQDQGASLGTWMGVIRRARMGKANKAVATALASYASPDGRDVRPGLARLTWETEYSYNVVKEALAYLRRMQLIEVTVYGHRSGKSDEYRLILGPDVFELLNPPDPDQAASEINKIRSEHRRGGPRSTAVRPSDSAVQADGVRPSEWAVHDDGPEGVRPTGRAVPDEGDGECTAHLNPGLPSGTAQLILPVRPTQWAATFQLDGPPNATTHPLADLGESVTPSRASSQKPDLDPLPKLCPHGLESRLRSDGSLSCPMCRRAAAAALTHPSLALRLVPREEAS